MHRPIYSAAMCLVSLDLAWAERAMGALYISIYTCSIGCYAPWCNMPVPSSCRSLVTFEILNTRQVDSANFIVKVVDSSSCV